MATKKFRCKVCGYVHNGDKAPDKCPLCGAPAADFEEIIEAGAEGTTAGKQKKGIDTNSNTYTIIYAAVMVIIVAFLLAFVSSILKEKQDANVLRDTKNQILISLNITGLEGAAVDAKYAEVITDTIEVAEGKSLYHANVDGAVKYVLPVKGRGLWGGLWGFISINEDRQNVFGAYFSHESETAGLGARIADRDFQEKFNGRPIFDAAGQVALTVVKDGAASTNTEVDGITGATLTSKGVGEMVTSGLSGYNAFLQGASTTVTPKKCCCKGNCQSGKACCGKGKCPVGENCCADTTANVESLMEE